MTFKHTLHRDYESKAVVDLKRTGVYKYAQDPNTDVWVCRYALDDGPVDEWLPGDPCPPEFKEAAENPEWEVAAFNDNFEAQIEEFIMAPRYDWPVIPLERHRCIMVQALAMGLPGNLEDAAAALKSPIQKDAAGARLMKKMMKPRKMTAPVKDCRYCDGSGIFYGNTGMLCTCVQITWWDEWDNIKRLSAYCATDVEAEREVDKRTFRLRPFEQALWVRDQRINARGVYVDQELCVKSIALVDAAKDKLDARINLITEHAVTGCTNRNQLVAWIREKGLDVDSVAKDQIAEMLARNDLDPVVREALELRREGARASTAKVDALLSGMDADGRARGLLQFLGAGATGRWAGRRFQPQNIVRPTLKDMDTLVDAIMTGDFAYFEMLYDNPLSAIGDAIRSMVTAAPGKKLLAADYANVEGRVAAWYAGEAWKVQAFLDFDAGIGPDLYKLAYGRSFGVDPNSIAKDDPRRQVGKVMELALQYQGGHGGFVTFAAIYEVDLDGLTPIVKAAVSEEVWSAAFKRYRPQNGFGMKPETWTAIRILIDNWRAAHPHIKQCWKDLEEAAMAAIDSPGDVFSVGAVRFKKSGSFLFMQLPSGRSIVFPYPTIKWKEMPYTETVKRKSRGIFLDGAEEGVMIEVEEPVYKESLCFKGQDAVTRQWTDQFAYGGQIFNYVVQGTARDLLAEAIVRVEEANYPVVLTVHDEVVSEAEASHGSKDEFCKIMATLPAWAEGCPIAADGWEGRRYRKA